MQAGESMLIKMSRFLFAGLLCMFAGLAWGRPNIKNIKVSIANPSPDARPGIWAGIRDRDFDVLDVRTSTRETSKHAQQACKQKSRHINKHGLSSLHRTAIVPGDNVSEDVVLAAGRKDIDHNRIFYR